jgi:hypothetical protein
MKAKTLLFVLMLLPSFYAFAKKYYPQFKIGIDAGPCLTKLRGNEFLEANYKSTLGYAAGISLHLLVPKSSVSFKSNIFYERKGAVSEDVYLTDANGSIIGTSHTTISLTYITVPLLMRVRSKGRVGVFINAGGFVGFLLNDETTNASAGIIPELKINNTDADNKLDGGFCGGAGLEIPIKEKLMASFEIRYNYGVYDINNTPRTRGGTVQTTAVNFLAGISYRLERKYKRR